MTAKDELTLILLSQEGDQAATEKLLTHLRPWLLRRLSVFKGDWKEDLLQHSMIGLLEAIRDFDPTLKVRLQTFAFHKIRKEVIKHLRFISNVRNFNSVQRKKFFGDSFPLVEPVSDESISVKSDVEEIITKFQAKKIIDEALSTLTQRERMILTEHIMHDNKTLSELGDELAITRERVRQVENEALKKLSFRLRGLHLNLTR